MVLVEELYIHLYYGGQSFLIPLYTYEELKALSHFLDRFYVYLLQV